jgi:hypothetical protein
MSIASAEGWIHRSLSAVVGLVALHMAVGVARAEPISADGRRLALVLDGMNVEQRWLPGDGVNWRTGEHDPAARAIKGHCSAFAAAVCAAFDIYILRPPEHSERLLANAQCGWLEQEGPRQGWTRIEDGVTAQSLANLGNLVLACYKNRDRDDPGHIAVIRPSCKSLKKIDSEGPDVTQAGARNHRRTSARIGFRLHARAWNRGEIVYYWHPIP